MHVWIRGETDRFTVSHHDFGRSYTLKLQQNYCSTVILSNSPLIPT